MRNYSVAVVFAMLVGCAGSPTKTVTSADADMQRRQAVQADPLNESESAQMNKAQQAIASQNWASAESLLTDLEVQRPRVSEIHASLGWVARQKGEYPAAIESYRRAFDLDPFDAVSANNLALLLREQGRFKEAVSLLKEGIEYSPDVADLHYNLAVIAELYLLDLELALEHYREFRALDGQPGQQVAGWIADLERRLN